MTNLNIDGMALAPGVVETIVSIAAQEVEGVATVGSSGVGNFRSMFGTRNTTQGVDIEVTDDDKLHVSVRIDVAYGSSLPDVASGIRSSVADAVASQVGIPVSSVDVYVDGIQFGS
ncbi:MAG: Asp23/Gls24 family envelope stress response protein [Eggerthellaceae bacterium]|nr:Asp23/Gls24 family envelope stress response protein [Eggerthellaceae bacterium]